MNKVNRAGLEVWESTHIGDELRPELQAILDANPEPCECGRPYWTRRHTAGSHLFSEAFVAYAPDLTDDQRDRLRMLFDLGRARP